MPDFSGIFCTLQGNLKAVTTMRNQTLLSAVLALAFMASSCGSPVSLGDSTQDLEGKLPAPSTRGKMSIEETLALRKSVRQFQDKPLTIEQISQLLWAAQGVTHSWGERTFRTAPSAGATYPFETYLFTASGGYRYNIADHSLTRVFDNDLRTELSGVSLGQTAVSDAHAVIVLSYILERTAQRYSDRAYRYVCIEAGHIAQNIHLMAVSLGLGSVPVGAFSDEEVKQLLGGPDDEIPLYIIPVGYELLEE